MSALLGENYNSRYAGFDLQSEVLAEEKMEIGFGAQTNYELNQVQGHASLTLFTKYTLRFNGWYDDNGITATFESIDGGDLRGRKEMSGGLWNIT